MNEAAQTRVGEKSEQLLLYVACVLASDADIWSDDSDFEEQVVVDIHLTSG
ncbi:PIN domain-containing protein [Halorussus pelagicus]|uniref:PIN domain-containing protein n=1 Tax=Halorussus pelagicus TaxID=2505977 RepID=UPI000FFC3EAA